MLHAHSRLEHQSTRMADSSKRAPRSQLALRYVPDYTRCVEHFALHAGGYAVLKGIQKGMGLPLEAMLPSFASLRGERRPWPA